MIPKCLETCGVSDTIKYLSLSTAWSSSIVTFRQNTSPIMELVVLIVNTSGIMYSDPTRNKERVNLQ